VHINSINITGSMLAGHMLVSRLFGVILRFFAPQGWHVAPMWVKFCVESTPPC